MRASVADRPDQRIDQDVGDFRDNDHKRRERRGNAERVGQVVRQYQTWQNTESTRTDTSRCVSGHHTTRKPVGRSTFTKTYRFVCSHRPHTNVTTSYREGKRIPMTRSRSLGRAWHARL